LALLRFDFIKTGFELTNPVFYKIGNCAEIGLDKSLPLASAIGESPYRSLIVYSFKNCMLFEI
jgi:hypothetical protein